MTPSTTFSITYTPSIFTSTSVPSSSSSSAPVCSSSAPPRPSPPPDLTVCAKNISLTASGEKVILWTREADRVILTTCQQEGANQKTFQAVSTLLGNKTPSEVSQRFQDLMRLFRTAARQTEDEAPPTTPDRL
ncbi:GON-4-like protein [Liparis tanakae]|uniref:GON-4-like protein n=1 Tax=Liparis tanakae TaxID=230148 RepID=A0A4Z2F944_9TELE|nr:GON-4-like protein [Liparis tanakae]